jgi:multiple sugar transport system permease protein
MTRKPIGFWICIYAALAMMAVYNLLPFFWMATSALKSEIEVVSYPATLWPREITFAAYSKIWLQEGFVRYFANSLIVSLSTAGLSSLVGVFAAYGFSRFGFRGRNALMTAFLATQMIPGVLLVGPYFKLMSLVNLYDTLLGLILAQTSITLPFSVWMLKGYLDTVPTEIDQAAMMDGATRLQTLILTILPNVLPGLVATMIFAFLLAWGDLLWALCLINDPSRMTITLGIAQLVGQFRVAWSEIMAATMIATIIPAAFYLFLQAYLIKGFTESAVKE